MLELVFQSESGAARRFYTVQRVIDHPCIFCSISKTNFEYSFGAVPQLQSVPALLALRSLSLSLSLSLWRLELDRRHRLGGTWGSCPCTGCRHS